MFLVSCIPLADDVMSEDAPYAPPPADVSSMSGIVKWVPTFLLLTFTHTKCLLLIMSKQVQNGFGALVFFSSHRFYAGHCSLPVHGRFLHCPQPAGVATCIGIFCMSCFVPCFFTHGLVQKVPSVQTLYLHRSLRNRGKSFLQLALLKHLHFVTRSLS